MRPWPILLAVIVGCGAPGPASSGSVEPTSVAASSVEPPASPEPAPAPATSGSGAAVACPDAFDAAAAPETAWTCSMHPQVRQEQPGSCPICGMQLVEDERTSPLTVEPPADVASVPDYAHVLPSGLATCVMRPGEGPRHPAPSDTVTVHYVGWSTDGESFDSSVSRGRPATFPLDRLIEGWTEGIPLMVEGEIRRLWIPGELAYGNEAQPGRPHGMLVFDIELLDIADEP